MWRVAHMQSGTRASEAPFVYETAQPPQDDANANPCSSHDRGVRAYPNAGNL